MELTDKSPMPFGKHKGTAMANVPASYLLWLWEQWNNSMPEGYANESVKAYIKDNLDELEMEVKK